MGDAASIESEAARMTMPISQRFITLRDASTAPVSIGSRCRQMMSAIARAPSAFGCARSACISCAFPMTFIMMNGTSGTR